MNALTPKSHSSVGMHRYRERTDNRLGFEQRDGAARLHFVLHPSERFNLFAEGQVDASVGYSESNYARLRRIRAHADPDGLVRANHEIR